MLGGASRIEAERIADRASLRWLVRHHPDWTQAELANAAAKLYNQGQPLATAEMQQVLERYGATQGYWAYYARIAVMERFEMMGM